MSDVRDETIEQTEERLNLLLLSDPLVIYVYRIPKEETGRIGIAPHF